MTSSDPPSDGERQGQEQQQEEEEEEQEPGAAVAAPATDAGERQEEVGQQEDQEPLIAAVAAPATDGESQEGGGQQEQEPLPPPGAAVADTDAGERPGGGDGQQQQQQEPLPGAAVEEDAVAPPPAHDDDQYAGMSYCVCRGGYFGQMVGCDGACEEWFHFACVGLKRLPRGEWLCQECAAMPPDQLAAVKKQKGEVKTSKRKVAVVAVKMTVEETRWKRSRTKEHRGKGDLENLVARAKSLKFDDGGALTECGEESDPSRPAQGAGLLSGIQEDIFGPLSLLHDNIVSALRFGRKLQSWEGTQGGTHSRDLRSRGFAFLPKAMKGSFSKERLIKEGVTFHAAEKQGKDAKLDEAANWRSCLTLRDCDLDAAATQALEKLILLVKEVVAPKYKKFIEMKHLIALQPNLHNGTEHLPPHLDFPLHDGFGVVIVTMQVKGPPCIVTLSRGGRDSAQVESSAELDRQREKSWKLWLRSGDAYILSGDARNYCDHGVLCLPPDGRRSKATTVSRESLNLRFGLHSFKKGADCSAYKEILHQFYEPQLPTKAAKTPKKQRPEPSSAEKRSSPRLQGPSPVQLDAT